MNSGQIILACDEAGKFEEYIPKEIGHTGVGKRHLAIAVLILNKGEVLLQRRKHKIFNNIWDITGATHPLHREDGSDESLEEATRRCLEDEWSIREIREVREVGVYNYFAKYDGLCENEHCHLFLGEYDGDFKLNSEVGYEHKWMKKEDFLKDIKKNPEKYTPWAVKAAELLKKMLVR